MSMLSSLRAEAKSRTSPLEMTEEQFRSLGHDLVDRIASFLGSLPERAVTPAETVDQVRAAFDVARNLPEQSAESDALLQRTADLLFDHSLLNGHPAFYG